LRWLVGLEIYLLAVTVTWMFVFPVVLLSSLTHDSGVKFWHPDVGRGLLGRPHVFAVLYLASAVLLAVGGVLGYLTIMELQLYLLPITGFTWSACVLIYGRLLGRVGWILVGDEEAAGPRRKRRKKRRADAEDEE